MTNATPDRLARKRDLRAGVRERRAARRTRSGGALIPDFSGVMDAALREIARRKGARGELRMAAFVPTTDEPQFDRWLRENRVLLPVLQVGERPAAPDSWQWHEPGASWEETAGGVRQPPVNSRGDDELLQLRGAGVDAVFVPALALDRTGTRLGHGAGWYDRALAGIPSSITTIGVVHRGDLLPAGDIPREPHDQSVQAVLTERELFWI